jgi:hypothetical protein
MGVYFDLTVKIFLSQIFEVLKHGFVIVDLKFNDQFTVFIVLRQIGTKTLHSGENEQKYTPYLKYNYTQKHECDIQVGGTIIIQIL